MSSGSNISVPLNKSKLKHSVCIRFGVLDPSGILDSSASLNKSKSKGCVGDLRITVIWASVTDTGILRSLSNTIFNALAFVLLLE